MSISKRSQLLFLDIYLIPVVENNYQIVTNPCTAVHDFSVKNEYLFIFTESYKKKVEEDV
jgi:hypothetical protein